MKETTKKENKKEKRGNTLANRNNIPPTMSIEQFRELKEKQRSGRGRQVSAETQQARDMEFNTPTAFVVDNEDDSKRLIAKLRQDGLKQEYNIEGFYDADSGVCWVMKTSMEDEEA